MTEGPAKKEKKKKRTEWGDMKAEERPGQCQNRAGPGGLRLGDRRWSVCVQSPLSEEVEKWIFLIVGLGGICKSFEIVLVRFGFSFSFFSFIKQQKELTERLSGPAKTRLGKWSGSECQAAGSTIVF